jgi:hypothetical protein
MAISIMLFYASFNIGILINYHFCYEEFHHLTVFIEPGNCCEDCPGCNNSSYALTISDDYDSQVLFSFNKVQVLPIVQQCLGFTILVPLPTVREIITIDPGPLKFIGTPTYLTNRVLLI